MRPTVGFGVFYRNRRHGLNYDFPAVSCDMMIDESCQELAFRVGRWRGPVRRLCVVSRRPRIQSMGRRGDQRAEMILEFFP